MNSYRVQYSEPWKQLIGLVVFPILIMGGGMFALVGIPGRLPDAWVAVSITLLVLLSVGFSLYSLFKWISVPCEISMNPQGIHFQIFSKSVFYLNREFTIGWEQIRSVSEYMTPGNGMYYILIKLKESGKTFQLSLKGAEGKVANAAYWQEMQQRIADFQSQDAAHAELKVDKSGFMLSWGAKAITGLVITGMLAILTVVIIKQDISDLLQQGSFLIIGTIWIVLYFMANRKK